MTGKLEVNWRNQACLLKNSFQGISTTKFACKLLNVRLPQTLKFAEITALVPFSTATGHCAQNPVDERNRDFAPTVSFQRLVVIELAT